MYLSLLPTLSRLHRSIFHSNSLVAAAQRAWVISPAVDSIVPTSIFEADDLCRIVGVPAETSISEQVKRAYGGRQHHAATVAYELRDAVISRGHLFTRLLSYRICAGRSPWFAKVESTGPPDTVLATSSYGVKYFGHWLSDDLPRILAARAIGSPISTIDGATEHQTDYLELLDLQLPVVAEAMFPKITVLEDHGQNLYKRERYVTLRERLRSRLGLGRRQMRHKGVMLLRGVSGIRRCLVNEQQVAEVVRQRGFCVLDPAHASVAEIVEACLDTEIVVGVEGSQLKHGLMWMSPRGTLLALQPPQRFTTSLKDRCDCEEIRYAFQVGERRGPDDFWIDIAALNLLLDRIDTAAAQRP